ncbi:YlmH/Sll1252 family protein [Streptococcus agalactiae]
MTLDDIYQHFRPEEYAFINKIDHLAQYVENTYSFITTEFLNPREFKILESVLERRGSHYYTSGQYFQTEYVKVIIAPEYYQLDMVDFNLSHAKIMGTLLNYLGVKRSILGDILVEEGCAQVLVDSQMTNHLVHSVTKIGTASVQLAEVPLSKLLTPKQDIQKLTVIASSLRLDKILATILKISRTQSTKLIEADKVKVNYAIVNRVSEQLVEGDLISVRGYGRFTLNHNLGLTKNQKYKLEVDKMIHN